MTDAKYAKAISPAGISCGAQLVEKASQSFAPYGRERDCNHFGGGVYVAENTSGSR